MTEIGNSGSSEARAELRRSRELAHQVRSTQRVTWFPLLVFAVLTLLAIPITRAGHPAGVTCRAMAAVGPGARVCVALNSATFIYWPIALVLGYAAIATFYVRRARGRGVGSRIGPYVAAGVVIAIILTGASLWAMHAPLVGRREFLAWNLSGPDVYRLLGPACAIGLGLLVLSGVERSLALLAVTLGYLVVAVGGVDFGWAMSTPVRWGFLPHLVIEGAVLLVASAAFALAQRERAFGA